jgi:hypothetical protein
MKALKITKSLIKSINTDVQIYLLASVRIICSIVYASAMSNPQGSVCKKREINFYLN